MLLNMSSIGGIVFKICLFDVNFKLLNNNINHYNIKTMDFGLNSNNSSAGFE